MVILLLVWGVVATAICALGIVEADNIAHRVAWTGGAIIHALLTVGFLFA